MEARIVQIYLLMGSRVVQTVMRMAMGPLVVYICDEIPCDASSKGTLLSAFSFGYISTQVIGGALADKIGPKAVITLAMMGAGLAALAMPCSGAFGVTGLWALSVLMGAAQGPLFPTSMAYLSNWLPPTERSFASTMLDTGITAGSLISLPVSGSLGASIGWRSTYTLYGIFTLVYVGIWQALAEADPHRCRYISAEELAFLDRTIKDAGRGGDVEEVISPPPAQQQTRVSTMSLLSHSCIWSIFVSHMAFNYGVYFQNSWTPTYYSDELGLRPGDAGVHFMAPHLCNLAVKLLSPKLMRHFTVHLQWNVLTCRRWFSVMGFVLSGGCLVLVSSAKAWGPRASTVFFSLTMGACALHPSGFKANYMDVSFHSSGIISGVGNTLASVASFSGPFVVAYILDNYNSWRLVFTSVALVNMVAAIFFCFWSSVTPVDSLPQALGSNGIDGIGRVLLPSLHKRKSASAS